MRKKRRREKLLFIDTNILLDFYRARTDAGIALLERIDSLHEKIITTHQVEMEFKKNRQKVILGSIISLKPPEAIITAPAYLSDAKTVAVMKQRLQDTKKRVGKLKDRIKRILDNPSLYDPVYKVVQRLFTSDSGHNLQRTNDQKYLIRRRAWRRFILGYPPRKKGDTSTGDAVNWEWIVRCVERTNHDVVIVSRDLDYGITLDDRSYPNDWLVQELKSRVNQQRRIHLYTRLSEALREFEITVSKEEEEEEQHVISQPAEPSTFAENAKEGLERLQEEVQRWLTVIAEQATSSPSKTDVP